MDLVQIKKLLEKSCLLPESGLWGLCGTDEAGRGPLAGPVYAGAVVLGKEFPFSCLNDSKKLSEKKRLEAEILIKKYAVAWSVAFCTHKEIDSLNILQASLLAMKRAVMKISPVLYQTVLADGNRAFDLNLEGKKVFPIIKGDSLVPQIMAASILAKTARDRFMIYCDRKWPWYGYASNKGYPTKAHREALAKYGPSPIQRKTFKF